MQTHTLEGGFSDQPVMASHAFRAVMTAMARPGEILDITGAQPPAPLSAAAGAVLLTLCDPETPIYLANSHATPEVRDWITFHTGAPFCTAPEAMFGLGSWDELSPKTFQIGTPEYPDRSATLIVESADLTNSGAVLSGPGIKGQARLPLPETSIFTNNNKLFPLGLDFIFTCGDRLAALPRTTKTSTFDAAKQVS